MTVDETTGPATTPPQITPGSGGTGPKHVSEGTYARRRGVLLAAVLAGVVVLIVAGVLGYQSINRRLRAAEKVDRAIELVERADVIVVAVDEVVTAKLSDSLAEKARAAGERVGEAKEKLEEAQRLADEAAPALTTSEKARTELVHTSAGARLDMLKFAPTLLSLNEKAATSLPLAREGWELLKEADATSNKAVAEYNKLNKKGVTQSRDLNRQAAAQLKSAKEKFTEAETAFSAAPFETYIAYIDRRLSINAVSQQTDKAWLADDLTKANSLIRKFNVEEPKAVAQFKALPASPDAAVGAAYDRESKSASDSYFTAKDRALEADKQLQQ